MKTSVLVRLFAASLALMLVAGACDDDDDNGVTPVPGDAMVRVIHASFDAPAVDVAVDDTVAISGLAYRESSGYAELEPGTRNVEVTPAGDTTPVVISADLGLIGGTSYTVYAMDSLTSIEPIVSVDDRAPVANQAKIRSVHAVPDAPAVDIKLNAGDGLALFENQAFKSVSDYVTIDPGAYTFAVTPAGATIELLVSDPITLEAGGVYTVIALGTLDNTDAYPLVPRVFIDIGAGDGFADLVPAMAAVNVIHASPDAPGVDILVDGMQVNTSELAFPDTTGYLAVPAGDREVNVNVAGTSTTVIDTMLNLDRGTAYSVFAIDQAASIEPLVLVDDLTPPAAGQTKVRFVHLSPNAPAVDITTDAGTVVFGDFTFKEASDFTSLSAGTYDLQVRAAGTSTVVLDLPPITFDAGSIYTVFARGLVGGTGDQALGAEVILNDASEVLGPAGGGF